MCMILDNYKKPAQVYPIPRCGMEKQQQIYSIVEHYKVANIKGQWGVPLTVYPWYLLCSLGILGDYNP